MVPNNAIAVPWYDSDDDFTAILGLLPVEESTGAMDYAEWVFRIEAHEESARKAGQLPIRIKITPDAIKAWVESRNVPVCRKTITEYAIFEMARRFVDG